MLRPPMEVDRVALHLVRPEEEYFEADQEIDVVNMSIQCHGCGSWGALQVEVSHCVGRAEGTAAGRQQGRQGPRKRKQRFRQRGAADLGKAARLGKVRQEKFFCVFFKCFNCGETGHRKQDCTKVGAIDQEAMDADASAE